MQEGPEDERPENARHESLLAFVGARVREARKRAKLTQTALAKAIGSGQSYIFQIEAGEANITLNTLVKIAVAVGLSPRALLPKEPSDKVAELLHATMQELDRANDHLRQLHNMILDEPNASQTDIPSES